MALPAIVAVSVALSIAGRPAEAQNGTGSGPIGSVKRIVRHFDFEEARQTPLHMPLHFYRVSVSDRGFPRFGDMKLSDDHASTGAWSFRFELGGGSMEARTPTAVVPVLPFTDYLISVDVRTAGLVHARTRVVSWLHDRDGAVIASSRAESQLVRTDGVWSRLEIRVDGRTAEAADLVVALQVLQPAQYLAPSARAERPALEDVRGFVWFDDVVIRHHPRIELTTGRPHGAIRLPELPNLHLKVDDLARETMVAELLVHDIDGRVVHRRLYDAEDALRERTVTLPIDRGGWYRAVFSLANHAGVVAERAVAFTVLTPAQERAPDERRSRLAVHLPPTPMMRLAAVPALIDRLGVRTVFVTVTNPAAAPVGSPVASAERSMLEALRDRGVRTILVPDALPAPDERDDGHGDAEAWLLEQTTWRGYFDALMMSHGHVAGGWRLPQPELIGPAMLRRVADAAQAALTESNPGQRLYVPWPAVETPTPAEAGLAVDIEVPYHARPPSLLDLGRDWAQIDTPLAVSLATLPDDRYDPRHRVTDLMLRALHAWRAEAPLIVAQAPWRWLGDEIGDPVIDPTFAAWRTLDHQLAGRRFAGTLDLGPDLHCWLLAGDENRSAALVAWSAGGAGSTTTHAVLAAGPVRRVDAFGNRTVLVAGERGHALEIDDTPAFIEGIDLQLARFRAGFRIEPHFAAAMHRVHEHSIVLRNPWPTTATGTIRLRDGDQWRISPRVQNFTIEAGGTARLPINLVLNRNLLAGMKRVEATVSMLADESYELELSTSIEIGLEDIEFSARWQVVANERGTRDLVITQVVTNRGQTPVRLAAFVLAPEMTMMRRPFGELPPNATAARSFRIEDGATRLAGREVRVGLTELNGAARLNRLLQIPAGIGVGTTALRAPE